MKCLRRSFRHLAAGAAVLGVLSVAPALQVSPWFGVYAPANTPKEIVTQFSDWFSAALKAPEIKEKLAVQELYPKGLCGADFTAFLRKQQEDYGRAIKETNFKVE